MVNNTSSASTQEEILNIANRKANIRRCIWNDFNTGVMRYCAHYGSDRNGNSLYISAINTLKRIDREKLFPGDREWRSHWGQFVVMLHDIAEKGPPDPFGGAPAAPSPAYVRPPSNGLAGAARQLSGISRMLKGEAA